MYQHPTQLRRSRLRRILVYAILLALLGLMQTVWPLHNRFGDKPNFLLILACLSGFLFGHEDGFVIGLIGGFILDYSLGRAIGLGMLVMMLAGILSARFLSRRVSRNPLFAVTSVALMSLLFQVATQAATLLATRISGLPVRLPLPLPFIQQALAIALLNAATALPLYLLLYFVGPYRRRPSHKTIDMSVEAMRF